MKDIVTKIKNNYLIILFALLSIGFVIPSIIYLIQNKTVLGFDNYYNFFINDGSQKMLSSIIYLILYILLFIIYVVLIKKANIFKNIKKALICIGIISSIYILMLPWTSSDIFYYMGVGELDSVHHQNPYYVTMKEYCDKTGENINDEILQKGSQNYWANTVVVYGPLTQIIFKILTFISFKNINICILVFKLFNILMHLLSCYLIYKITKKMKFVILYGLNPFVFLEFIGNVHIDVVSVFLILLSLYFVLKKKNILASVIVLSFATGLKYFTVLLLPVVVLYHYREEQNIMKRLLKCIEYGSIFILVFALQYALYFRDASVLTTVSVQTKRYCKSIYTGILSFSRTDESIYELADWDEIKNYLHYLIFGIFAFIYIVFCIKLLCTKKIKIMKTLRDYNLTLIIFLISLSNFQQWYLIWPFASIMWQNPKMIRNLTLITLASEIGNSVYMFNRENWKYDYGFVLIIIAIMIIYNVFYRLLENRRNEEINIEENN